LFRPEDEPEVSNVAICEECVLTCAKAIDVEQRLTERPPSKPLGDAVPDSERPARQVHWNAFQVGKLGLEWRAERGVVVSVRRRDNHERVVFERFGSEIEPSVDDAETVAEDHWTTLHG
jgi:hypothetical protein